MTTPTADPTTTVAGALNTDTSSTAASAKPDIPGRVPRSTRSKIGSVLLGVLMTAMLGLAIAAVAVPKILGALPLTVLTSSMEPTLSPGDVVVVQPVDPEDVSIGDVVTFQPVSDDPTLVTHRVVGVQWGGDGVAGFVTRGDANGADDDPIVPDQVMGRVVYSIPFIGHATNASWGPTAVTVGAVGLIAYSVLMIVTPDSSRRKAVAP